MSTASERLIEKINLFFPAKLREEYVDIVKDLTHPSLAPEKIANGAIEMFLEYQYAHGKNEEEAKYCAVREILEGVDAIKEMKAYEAEIRAMSSPNLTAEVMPDNPPPVPSLAEQEGEQKRVEEERRYGTWHGKYRVDFIKEEEQGIEL